MSDLLNVGASALRAAYSQMRTTGHNLSLIHISEPTRPY